MGAGIGSATGTIPGIGTGPLIKIILGVVMELGLWKGMVLRLRLVLLVKYILNLFTIYSFIPFIVLNLWNMINYWFETISEGMCVLI